MKADGNRDHPALVTALQSESDELAHRARVLRRQPPGVVEVVAVAGEIWRPVTAMTRRQFNRAVMSARGLCKRYGADAALTVLAWLGRDPLAAGILGRLSAVVRSWPTLWAYTQRILKAGGGA